MANNSITCSDRDTGRKEQKIGTKENNRLSQQSGRESIRSVSRRSTTFWTFQISINVTDFSWGPVNIPCTNFILETRKADEWDISQSTKGTGLNLQKGWIEKSVKD